MRLASESFGASLSDFPRLIAYEFQAADSDPPPEPPSEAPIVADDQPMDVEAVEDPEMLEAEDSTSPFSSDEGDGFDECAIAKEALKSEISDGLSGARPDKAVIGEILLALEAQNPTQSPATSSLLNGKWKFLYASGASPGLKALQTVLKGAKVAPKSPSGADILDVADTFLTIKAEQPRAAAEVKVRLLSFENTLKLSSNLEAESAVRLVETYDAAESEYMSLRLPFQSPVQYRRSVLISYLDGKFASFFQIASLMPLRHAACRYSQRPNTAPTPCRGDPCRSRCNGPPRCADACGGLVLITSC